MRNNSRHWIEDREERRRVIAEIGEGHLIKEVEVDRHHRNGPEIHQISDTGIITILNKRTRRMVTQLIARPGQIRRYYAEGETIPTGLIEIARQHQRMALNYAQKRILKKILFSFGAPLTFGTGAICHYITWINFCQQTK